MLSNTFNLFNFFQQPNTGKNKVLESEEEASKARNPLINNSGAVADFNWFFPYARKIIPNAIIAAAGTKGFPITLFSDSREIAETQADSILGLRYASFEVGFGGNFLKDKNDASFNFQFSGKIFPKDLDEEKTNLYLSGLITGDSIDRYSSKLNITGKILNGNPHYNYFNYNLSGNISGVYFDTPNIKTVLTGSLQSGIIQNEVFENRISGSFFPINKDSCYLEYSLLSYSTGKSVNYLYNNLEDQINNLSYSLESYNLNQ